MSKGHISSRLTLLYKYFYPSFFISIFILLTSSIFYNFLNIEIDVRIFLSFFAFIFCLFMIPLVKLKIIFYDEKYTYIKGFRNEERILNADILKVRRYMFYFYRIFYFSNGKIVKKLFLPHIVGVFLRFGGKPKSIKRFEVNIK